MHFKMLLEQIFKSFEFRCRGVQQHFEGVFPLRHRFHIHLLPGEGLNPVAEGHGFPMLSVLLAGLELKVVHLGIHSSL